MSLTELECVTTFSVKLKNSKLVTRSFNLSHKDHEKMSAHESLCRKFKNDNKLCSYVTLLSAVQGRGSVQNIFLCSTWCTERKQET